MASTRQTVLFEAAERLNGRNYHSWENDVTAAEGAFKIVTRNEAPRTLKLSLGPGILSAR